MADLTNIIAPGAYTYNPKSHKLVIAGIVVADYAEDTKIEMEFTDSRSIQNGVDGAVSISEYATIQGTFKVHVLQNSPMAELLKELAWKEGKKAVFPVMYGNMTIEGAGYYSSYGVFKKLPSESIGKDAKEIVFEIVAPKLEKVK